jgi:PKHD-type hydroxylase
MYLQNNHCISVGKFTESFCNQIIDIAGNQQLKEATIQDGNNNNRSSKITWLKNNSFLDNQFIKIIEEHNKKANWNFALHDLEPLQYTVYYINDHYDWHIDSHTKPYNNGLIRKISFTLCLNEDYEGGEFEISSPNPKPEKHINTKFTDKFTLGTFISFPSFVWHKVNPVTSGTRKVLVGWSLGPQFI